MLNNNEKKEVSKIYAMTCKAFDKTLEPDVLMMQVEDLADLDSQEIINALGKYRLDEKNIYWPRASKIRAIINPKTSKESLANESASRVRAAISKYGWNNGVAAENYIGEIGWQIVKQNGGWRYICENHGSNLDPMTFHAQARDLARAIIESGDIKKFDLPQIENVSMPKNLIDFKTRK